MIIVTLTAIRQSVAEATEHLDTLKLLYVSREVPQALWCEYGHEQGLRGHTSIGYLT